jgi:hypothetical protein
MKKLGTPPSTPPSVEGSGGVSAKGATALALELATPGCAGADVDGALPRRWLTAVRGWGCRARTSGAGAVVVSGPGASLGDVSVVVVAIGVATAGEEGCDGAGCGGAGTVVVGGAGAEPSSAETVAVVSASAALAGIRMASTASGASAQRGKSDVVVDGRRIIAVSCRAGS